MTIISERLQHLRLTHGYTQTELARTMGVTRRAVYAWEHDKCPEIPHLIQLAQFYQVSTDYLLGRTEWGAPRHWRPYRILFACYSAVNHQSARRQPQRSIFLTAHLQVHLIGCIIW